MRGFCAGFCVWGFLKFGTRFSKIFLFCLLNSEGKKGEAKLEGTVFERYEYKYVLGPQQYTALLEAIAGHIEPDAYGESTVCSLYYDTPDFRLARRSLEKPVYKEKLRLRSYGQATPESNVFLELKKKYRGVVYKRRILLPERDAAAYLNGEAELPGHSQIGREIDYFRSFYGTVQPTVCLCYDRTAFVCPQDPRLRLTFDRRVRWRAEALALTEPPDGALLLPEEICLLEIKTAASIPLWLVSALEAGCIRRTGYSKYGAVYQNYLKQELCVQRGREHV